MKAAVLYKDLDIRYEEFNKPSIKNDEILIRVKATGVCGSDLPRVLSGHARYYPIILGHEFSGQVEEVGADVSGISIGENVSAAPLVPCHKCEDCLRGDHALCKHYSFIGSRQSGTWAEYVAVPAVNITKLSDDIDYVAGAFLEPITVALHGLLLMNFQPAKKIAIVGMGTIGLLTLQCAKIMGAREITVFDIDDAKLDKAKTLGADYAVNSIDKDYLAQTNPRGYDYVLDCVGSPITIKMSIKLCGNKGKVMYIGTPTGETTLSATEFEQINRKEMTIQASWMSYSAPYPGIEWELAAEYLAKNLINVKPLLYKTVKLSDAQSVFEEIKETGAMPGKIIMEV